MPAAASAAMAPARLSATTRAGATGEHLFQRALRHQTAVVDDDDIVGERFDVGEVVTGDDHGPAVVGELAETSLNPRCPAGSRPSSGSSSSSNSGSPRRAAARARRCRIPFEYSSTLRLASSWVSSTNSSISSMRSWPKPRVSAATWRLMRPPSARIRPGSSMMAPTCLGDLPSARGGPDDRGPRCFRHWAW